jgi:hypothetical protein
VCKRVHEVDKTGLAAACRNSIFFLNSFHRLLVKGLILVTSLLAAAGAVSDYDQQTTDARLSFVCPTRDVRCRSHTMVFVQVQVQVHDRVRDLGFLSGTYSRREYLAGVTPLA